MCQALPSVFCPCIEPCPVASQLPMPPTHWQPPSRASLPGVNPHRPGGDGAGFVEWLLFPSSCLPGLF